MFINDVFERANIQGLREYLLTGAEALEYSSEGYEERIKKSYEEYKVVAERHGLGEGSELYDVIQQLLITYETVYMEVGLQAGLLLAKDVYGKGDLGD